MSDPTKKIKLFFFPSVIKLCKLLRCTDQDSLSGPHREDVKRLRASQQEALQTSLTRCSRDHAAEVAHVMRIPAVHFPHQTFPSYFICFFFLLFHFTFKIYKLPSVQIERKEKTQQINAEKISNKNVFVLSPTCCQTVNNQTVLILSRSQQPLSEPDVSSPNLPGLGLF